MMKANLNQG